MKYRAMMLGLVLGIAMTAVLLLNGRVLAQDDAVTTWKIAVVDRKAVFNEYKKQQEEMKKLQAQLNGMQGELDEMSKTIQSAKDSYLEKRDSMPEAERDAEKSRIQQEFVKYEAELKSRQAKMDAMTAALIKEVKGDIDAAIAKFGEENRYHLILESDTDPQSRTAVLYYHTKIDITIQIQEILNDAYAKGQ
ncbi:MAG TPA: OmpH family outer membrane protein [Candidatus Hydrogenedentes bacterium]|nr:OmpH family outer membrane protein [Candidatus Hydrogenedentota bacterium]